MLSNLTAEHAPALVKHLLAGRPSDGGMWKHWRGRYGLSEEDQGRLWASVRAGHEELGFGSTRAREKEEVGVEVVKLRFRTFESEVKEVDGRLGEDLLDVGRREGLPALEGVCGGNLGMCPSRARAGDIDRSECATCHLYLPPGTPVPAPSEEELDMLGYALGYRDGESRLGCQIRVTPELAVWAQAGGIVGLPRF
jgi:ferredoxin